MNNSDTFRRILSPTMASLTLGLAPFFPEPHILGKLRWLMGGAKGMQFMDYFDVVLHGTPWVWLLYTLYQVFVKKK